MTWTETAIARLRNCGAKAFQPRRSAGASRFRKTPSSARRAHEIDLPPRPTPIKTGNPSPPKRRARPRAPVSNSSPPPIAEGPAAHTAPLPEPGRNIAVSARAGIAEKLGAGRDEQQAMLWPMGAPGAPGYRFRQAPALVSKPYCPEHAKRAYARKRDRREDADPRRSETMRQP